MKYCPNINSTGYKNLYERIKAKLPEGANEKKIEALSYAVWNSSAYGVGDDGFPLIPSLVGMHDKFRDFILSLMTPEEEISARAKMKEYIEENPSDVNFGVITTSSGQEIVPIEKQAIVNMFFRAINDLFKDKSREGATWDEIEERVKVLIKAAKKRGNNAYNKIKDDPSLSEDEAWKLYDIRTSYNNSYDKILDEKAFKELSVVARRRMYSAGISRESGVVNVSDIDATTQSQQWNATDQFKIDERSYSTGKIKLLMSSLDNWTMSVLGEPALYSQDEAYRNVLAVLSYLPIKSYDFMIDRLRSLAGSVKSNNKNIYAQLVDILDSRETPESVRIQFQTAMNKVRADQITVLVNPENNSDVRTVSAQMNSLKQTIKTTWLSNILYNLGRSASASQHLKNIGRDFLQNTSTDSIKRYFSERMKDPNFRMIGKKERFTTAKKEIILFETKKLFKELGLELSDSTWDILYYGTKEDIYNAKNGLTTRARSFALQEHPTTGVFGIIAKSLSDINVRSTNPASIASDLNQSVLTFLSNIEAISSNKFAPNSFIDYNGEKVFGYANSTPLHRIMGKLAGSLDYVRELAQEEFAKFSYFLGPKYFGGESDYRNKLTLTERFGFKQIGTDFKSQKNEMSLLDIYHQSIGLFINNGSDIAHVSTTAYSDKPRSILISAPREELNVVNEDGSIDIDVLKNSSLMDHIMSIVRAEASRIADTFIASNDVSGGRSVSENYIKKQNELKRLKGKNFIDNAQYFHSFPFLNRLLKFDENFVLDVESIENIAMDADGKFLPSVDATIRQMMSEHFIEEMNKDIANLEKLGLYQKDSEGNVLFAPISAEYAAKKDEDFAGYKNLKLKFTKRKRPRYTPPKNSTIADDIIFDEEYVEGAFEMQEANMDERSYDLDDEIFGSGNITANKDAKKIANYNQKIDNLVKLLMLEMKMNSVALSSNVFMITSGDIATAQKSAKLAIADVYNSMIARGYANDSRTKDLAIQNGLDNFFKEPQKRLMSKIAPATDAVLSYKFTHDRVTYTGKKTYRVGFINDFLTIKGAAEYLNSIGAHVGLKIKDLISKGTDGFEYVSVYHRLESLYRLGKLNEKEFINMRNIYMNGGKFSAKDVAKMMFSTEKPRQQGFKTVNINGKNYRVEVYIKSAELPLLRQFTETANQDLNTLRLAMEEGFSIDPTKDTSIGRVAHVSATKMGAQNPLAIYNEDSSLVTNDPKLLHEMFTRGSGDDQIVKSIVDLEWDSYGIQQESPYDPDKSRSVRYSQPNNTILAGVKDFLFKYRGEEVGGDMLEARKDSIIKEKLSRDIKKANEKLKVKNGIIKAKTIFDLMKSRASRSSISAYDVTSTLFLVRNKIPLILSNARSKIESLLNSEFSTGVMVAKVPGNPYVQMPLPGKNIIAKTDSNPIHGLIRVSDYNGSSPLKMTKVVTSSDNKLSIEHTAEVIVPFRFMKYLSDSLGRVGIEHFVKDGVIDSSKVPDSVLKIIGLRIPNQGHSSQILLKIVGFTPDAMGDVCFVPFEITTQMGSDFDIDKLYTYWRNYFITKDNKIISLPKDIVSFDEVGDISINQDKINSWIEDKKDDIDATLSPDKIAEMALDDAYFDIFSSVLSHPQVARMAMSPLDAKDLQVLADENRSYSPKGSVFSQTRQLDEYFLQQSSGGGIDIFSKIMSAITLLDGKSVRIGRWSNKENKNVFSHNPIKKFAVQSGDKVVPLNLGFINPFGNSVMVYDGEDHPRTALKNIIILQTESIDNANNDALVPNNLNEFTFPIAASMVLLSNGDSKAARSLDLAYVTRFLNQEAIKMLVDGFRRNKGVMLGSEGNESKAAKLARLIGEVKYELLEKYGVSNDLKTDDKRSYTSEDLLSLMINKQEDLDLYVASQFDMLDTFKKLNNVSEIIFNLNNQTSFDNKGMKPSVEENNMLIDNINEGILSLQKVTDNPRASLTTVISIDNNSIKKSNAASNNIAQAININRVISNSMGHTDSRFTNAMSLLNQRLQYALGNAAYNAENVALMIKSLQSFLTAKSSFLKGLRISDFTKTKLLVNQYYELKNSDQYPELVNNMFFNSLKPSKNLEHISAEAMFGDDDLSQRMSNDFANMFRSANPKIKEFADNIIRYELLTGGIQGPNRMIRYIDPYVLNSLGYYSNLKDSWERLNNNNGDIQSFLDLFFANNRKLFIKKSPTASISAKEYEEGGYEYIVHHKKYYKAIGSKQIGDKGQNIYRRIIYYEEMKLRGSDAEIESIEKSKAANKYEKVIYPPKYVDYSDNGEYVDIHFKIDANEKNDIIVQTQTTEETLTKSFEDIDKLSNLVKGGMDIVGILDRFIGENSTTIGVTLMDIIDQNREIFSNIRVVFDSESTRTNQPAYYDLKSGKIVINMEAMNDLASVYAGDSLVEEILVHEVVHAIHTKAYLLGKNGVKQFVKLYEDTNTIFNIATEKILPLNVIDVATGRPIVGVDGKAMNYSRFINNGSISYTKSNGEITANIDEITNDLYGYDAKYSSERSALKQALNAFESPIEFSAEIMSRRHLQTMMKTIIVPDEAVVELDARKSRNTLYKKFMGLIVDLLHSLTTIRITNEFGMVYNGRTLLESAVVNNMMAVSAMIEHASVVTNNLSSLKGEQQKYNFPSLSSKSIEKVELGSTIREFLQGVSKDARAGFRNLLNNGAIKTKCD